MSIVNYFKKITIKDIIVSYLIIYFALMLLFCTIIGTTASGEFDDYIVPAVSIITQHNFGIDNDDINNFKDFFPEWNERDLWFSPYKTKNGDGQMAWYFPTYSIACIPLIVFFRLSNILPTSYAFIYTNLLLEMFLLFTVYKCLKVEDKKKLLLILALSINPIIFYLSWPSAEIMIYSFIGIAMLCWYNKWYKRAAIAISIAGTLNPTILCIGIIMIIDYFIAIFKDKRKDEKLYSFIKHNISKVILYGLCYIIALIPFAYNLYNIGHINLTASLSYHFIGNETIFQRFIAYLFDINLGILPYFTFLFIISLILIPFAFYKKEWKYLIYMGAFFINIILFSIMININHGMAGISRYGAWVSVVMIYAVCLYWDKIIEKNIFKKVVIVLILLSICLTGCTVIYYGGINAQNTSYLRMLPIAQKVLDCAPWLYNPLHSTFNSRVCFQDGGYDYNTPIVYFNSEKKVKKILATEKDKDLLLNRLEVTSGDKDWFENKINSLTEKETYISIPYDYSIIKKH